MNDSEQRRKELLAQMRRAYEDRKEPPAVHPRYQAAYGQLYREKKEEHPAGSFGFRLFLSVVLFVLFVLMDRQEYEVMDVGSARIAEEIQDNFDPGVDYFLEVLR